jgi:Na+/proline symporter
MHTAAACFLLPVGVVLYTMFGGIKATFLTDYGMSPLPRVVGEDR